MVLEEENLRAPRNGRDLNVSEVDPVDLDVGGLLPKGFAAGKCVKKWSGSVLGLGR